MDQGMTTDAPTPTPCSGRGECLAQGDDGECDQKHPGVSCAHACKVARCANHVVCKSSGPQWYYDAHRGRCVNCATTGLSVVCCTERDTCPVCLDAKILVQLPSCIHSACPECFGALLYGSSCQEPTGDDEAEWDAYERRVEEDRAARQRCPLCRSAF